MIQEIIILNDKGIPIFHHGFGASSIDNHHYQLIASYFDQICRFTKFGFKESLNTLKMDKSVFYFRTHPISNLHLILKCDGKTDEEKSKKKSVEKCALLILDKFIARYKKELSQFRGNITPFKSFSEDLEEIIDSKLKSRPKIFINET